MSSPKKKRLVLAVSNFQIIVAKALLEKLAEPGVVYEDSIVLCHEAVPEHVRARMVEAARRLGFSPCVDVSDLNARFFQSMRFAHGLSKIGKILRGAPSFANAEASLHQMRDKIQREVGLEFDQVFVRHNYRAAENALLTLVLKYREVIGTPESIVDGKFRNSIAPFFSYRVARVKKDLKNYLKAVLAVLVLGIRDPRFFKLSKAYFPVFVPFDRLYYIVDRSGPTFLAETVPGVLRRLEPRSKLSDDIRVIIAGTIQPTYGQFAKHRFSVEEECLIYNEVVRQLCAEKKISPSQIIYKPHPRIRPEVWKYKSENLRCKIYPFESNTLIDYDLANNDRIEMVASVMSDSIINAKILYKKETLLIDLRSLKPFPVQNEIARFSQRFGIQSLILQRHPPLDVFK